MGPTERMDKTAELTTRFGLIDTNSNGKLEKSELVAVFGEHAEEFLKFCDAGEKDGVLTCEEFCAGIIEDTKDMSDADFQANWLDRMSKCIEDAKPAAPEKPDMKLAMEKVVDAFNNKYNA